MAAFRAGAVLRGVVGLLVAAAVVGAGVLVSRSSASPRSGLSLAAASVPSTTTTFSYTDWTDVRRDLGLEHPRTAAQLSRLETDGFADDLTTRSPMRDSIAAMQKKLGWSPATLDWDAYGQSSQGNVLVARLDASVSTSRVRGGLADAGWSASDGVWSIDSSDLYAALPDAPTDLSHLVFVDHGRTIVASESTTLLRRARRLWSGHGLSLASVAPARQTIDAVGGSTAVLLQDTANACASTTMSKQSATVLQQSRTAVRAAGGLTSPVWEARALTADGTRPRLAFAMAFGSGPLASRQAVSRASLATGPFIGRSGTVQQQLRLDDHRADGSVAVLRFTETTEASSFMAAAGPVLFAACSAG